MKIMVMIPTWNERGNITKLLDALMEVHPSLIALVVDDNSPDKTADCVKAHPQFGKRVELLLRTKEKGRGKAGIEGFLKCLEENADLVIEMDADFSHHPRYIPDILKAMEEADVVLGSRAVSGGKETGRDMSRQGITWFANNYIRFFLGIKGIGDCTSGYRCFKREVLQQIRVEKMESVGASIVEEVLYACYKKGFRIKEVPIVFEDRFEGESTKTIGEYIDTALRIIKFRIKINDSFFNS